MGAVARNAFLAGGSCFVSRFRCAPWREWRREQSWPDRRSPDWLLLLPHLTANWRPMVGSRLSHVMGLGRELSLLGSRQRPDDDRPPSQLILPRPRLAHRRLGRPGRQLARLRSDRSSVGGV